MDKRAIVEAVEAYKQGASPADAARLDFFEALFRLQQQRAELVGKGTQPPLLDSGRATEDYRSGTVLLGDAPASVDAGEFAETCRLVAAHLAENAGLDDAVAAALAAHDWATFVEKLDLAQAGSNPPQFVEDCLQNFDGFGIGSALPASIVMMVVSFALRAHIQEVAADLFALVDDEAKDGPTAVHPVSCPVCGSPAALSHVAMASGLDGRARRQYCSMCGTAWPYERMRCGVCGSENPTKLHYFNVEGDESHRLQNCDECGQYQRVFFEESLEIPVCLEVEDVVMAKLDHIALDPRFRS